jgi:SAM-dependent methyltransferase
MLVEAAKRSRAEVRFCQGDVEWLPFRSACFDLVTCRFSGHHFPNPDAFAGETARVLRPGGQLLLGDVVAPSDPALDRWINHLESLRDLSHVRDRTVAEWTGALQSAGLTCELLLDWRLELDFQAWVERIRTPPTAIAELRAILQAADAAPRAAFAIRTPPERPWSFQLHCAVVRARR